MNKIVLFIGLAFLKSISSYGQCNADEQKMLVLGDSWAFFSWTNNSYNENLDRFGFSDKKAYSTSSLSVSGTRANNFFTPARIQELTNALNDNPSIEFIHFSLGGNDILGTYHVSNTAAQNNQDYFTLMTDMKAGIDIVHNINPTLKILLSGYDYPNFEETIQNFIVPSQHPFYNKWMNMGQPTASQLNSALIDVTNRFIDSAAVWENVEFVSNLGLMQNTYGQNTPLTVAPGGTYAAGSLTVPNGLPNYPSPTTALNFGGTDSFHLNNSSFELFIKRHFQEYYWKAIRNASISINANDSTLNGTVSPTFSNNDSLSIGAEKGILTFNTSSIDPTKNIEKASLFLKRAQLNGANLIDQDLTLEIKSGYFGANIQIELDDYLATADANSIACTYGTVSENDSWMRIDIPSELIQHLTNSDHTQFRLFYENVNSDNYFNFYNSTDTNKQAILDITYNGFASVTNNKIKNESIIFPNPFKEKVNIKTQKTINAIKIYDISGKLIVLKNNLNKNYYSENTNALKSGVYNLKIEFIDGSVESHKIIK